MLKKMNQKILLPKTIVLFFKKTKSQTFIGFKSLQSGFFCLPLKTIQTITDQSFELFSKTCKVSLYKALWGTFYGTLTKTLRGVTKGYTLNFLLYGVGFKFKLNQTNIILNLGFHKARIVEIPKTLTIFSPKKNALRLFSYEKEMIGNLFFQLTNFRKINKYKRKGFLLRNKEISLKLVQKR